MNENIADGNTGQGSPEFRSNSKPRSRNGKKVANTDNTNKQGLGVLRIWKRKISEITAPGLDDTRNPQKNPESQFQSDSSRSGNENLLPGKNRSAPTEDDFANTRQQRDLFHRYINAQRREGEAKEEVEKVQKECRDIRNQQDVLTEEKRRLVSQLTELKEENLRGAEKIKTQEGETERIREENRTLRLQKEKLESKYREQDGVLVEMTLKESEFEKTIEELQEKNESLRSEKKKLESRSENDIKAIMLQIVSLERKEQLELQSARQECEKIRKKYSSLLRSRSKTEKMEPGSGTGNHKSHQEYEKDIDKWRNEYEKCQKALEDERLQNFELEQKIQVEVQSARQECEEIREKYSSLLQSRSDVSQPLQKENESFSSEREEFEQQRSMMEAQIQEENSALRLEKEKLEYIMENDIKAIMLQIVSLERKEQLELQSARQECEKIRKKYSSLLQSRSNVSQPLQTENESFSSEREEFEQQRSNMEAQIQRLRQTIENLRSEFLKTAAENAILRMQTILSQREKTSRSPEHKEFTSRPPPREEDNLEYPQENDRPGSEGHDSNGVFLDPCTDNMSKEAKDYQGGFNEDLIQYIQTTLKNNRNTMVHSEKIEGKEYYYVNIKELKTQINRKFRVNLCDDEIIGHVREDTGYNPPPGSVRSKIEHDGSSFCYVHNPPEYVLNKSSNSASLSESKDTGKMTKSAKSAKSAKKTAKKTAEKTAENTAEKTAKPANMDETAEMGETAKMDERAETEDEIDESESDARGSDEDSSGSDNE